MRNAGRHRNWVTVAVAVVAGAVVVVGTGLAVPLVVVAAAVGAGWAVVRAWSADVPEAARSRPRTGASREAGRVAEAERVAGVVRMAGGLPRHLLADPAVVDRLVAAGAPKDPVARARFVDELSEGVGR